MVSSLPRFLVWSSCTKYSVRTKQYLRDLSLGYRTWWEVLGTLERSPLHGPGVLGTWTFKFSNRNPLSPFFGSNHTPFSHKGGPGESSVHQRASSSSLVLGGCSSAGCKRGSCWLSGLASKELVRCTYNTPQIAETCKTNGNRGLLVRAPPARHRQPGSWMAAELVSGLN